MRILYLDLDTLRPDHLGCYGYHRNTSPNIDRIAAQGVRFDRYYTPDAPCLPSRSAMMSGQFGIRTGAVGHGGTCADRRLDGPGRDFMDQLSAISLPATLKKSGLHTCYIGGFGERHSTWTFYAGFREVHDTGKLGMESAEDVTPAALSWIKQYAKEDNWYLQINYWDPHTPYRAPEEFGNPFEDEPGAEWITDEILQQHRQHVGPHGAREINMFTDAIDPDCPRHPGELKTLDDVKRMHDGYDCGIRYMDNHIGRLFQALEKEGVMDDLCIIISSDHGENMGELGLYGEHATADQITCRIPMIIRWPGCSPGTVDNGFRYNLDLLPTLADLLGQEASAEWDGQSFVAALQGGKAEGRESLVLSQCAHVCQRSVRFGDWLYMRTYHDGYHLFDKEMLYNITEDAHEQNNLAESRADICKDAAYKLMEWHDEMMARQPDGYCEDPMRRVILEGGPHHARGKLPSYCERLEHTGRGDAVPKLKMRHPVEFSLRPKWAGEASLNS